MTIERILIIDDEEIVRQFLYETLHRAHYDVVMAENGKEGLTLFKEGSFDLVFTDMKMPDITGLEVLKKVKELSPQTIVIVITGYGSIENAVEAMRFGAFHYLIKPFSQDIIETVIEKAKEHQKLLDENAFLRRESAKNGADSDFQVISESFEMKKILKDVSRIARSNANVFISGESGTGKEVIAQAIHTESLRAGQPFIKVNCAAIPETLVESEFFGHEKGAFTGANQRRIGRFELAHGGTLLLDEVTEIPLTVQAKLLRAIQEQTFERVGGSKPIRVDVRIISTSNRDVKQAIEQKILREDLYYRLNVVPIHLSPLRQRREDILPLAHFFAQKMCRENHKEAARLTAEAERKLLSYSWPGNVRELANVIERAVVMSSGTEISPDLIFVEATDVQAVPASTQPPAESRPPVGMSLYELEKALILETLEAHQQNRTKAAEILGISTRTLRNKLQEYAKGQ